MIMNVTYQGRSADTDLGEIEATDADIRRIAVEMLRSGSIEGMRYPDLADNAFNDFVVERTTNPQNVPVAYLRPKTAFGVEDVTKEVFDAFPILKYFIGNHLPENLRKISMSCEALAYEMAVKYKMNDLRELAKGLDKLLEAKDCFVRARL